MTRRFGIDISSWDGDLDPQRLKAAGIEFVVIRCGYADKGIAEDPLFEENYRKFRAAGILIGVYWYSVAEDEQQAIDEAEHCLAIIDGKRLEYGVWMDVETRAQQQMSVNQPGKLGRTMAAFCDRIRQDGHMVGIYSWKWLLEPCSNDVYRFPWWICAWTKNKPSGKVDMWQFGGETNELRSPYVAGYGPMDQDYCYTDYEGGQMLSIPERIAQAAEHFANHDAHGYSQPNRGCGGNETIHFSDGTHATISDSDVDCSEMVRQCVNAAFDREVIDYMWTGNEDQELRRVGFKRMPFRYSDVRRGDVLWVTGHTGIAIGGGRQADAHGDEQGGITGPRRGDQTGHEVEVRGLRSTWTIIYRYGSDEPSGWEVFPLSKKVRFPDGVNIREAPSTKSAIVGEYGPGESCVIDGTVISEGLVWGTYVGASSGKRRYVALAHMDIAKEA